VTGRRIGTSLAVFLVTAAGGACEVSAQEQPANAPSTQTPTPVTDQTTAPTTAPNAAPASSIAAGDGRELLRSAADAIKSLQSLTYRVSVTQQGSLEGRSVTVDAQAKLQRPAPGEPFTMRLSGSGWLKPGDPPSAFDTVWRTDTVSFIDYTNKRLVHRSIRGAGGPALRMAAACRLAELVGVDPLANEIDAAEVLTEEQRVVDGVLCDVVVTQANARRGRSRWLFGAADHLPRRVEKIVEAAGFEGGTIISFHDLATNVTITQQELTLNAPEGFKVEGSLSGSAPNKGGAPAPHAEAVSPPGTTQTGGADAAPGAAPADARPVVEFDLAKASGGTVKLSELRGRPVVLFFWGTWSLSSRGAEKTLAEVAASGCAAALEVVSLAVREKTSGAAVEYLSSLGRSYTIATNGEDVARHFGVSIFPTLVVIDVGGHEVARVAGYSGEDPGAPWRDAIAKSIGGGQAPAPREGSTTTDVPQGSGE